MGGQPTRATPWKNSRVATSLGISTANGRVAVVRITSVRIQLPLAIGQGDFCLVLFGTMTETRDLPLTTGGTFIM